MFHCEMYSSSLSTGTANAFQQVNAITTGNILPTQNSGYTVDPRLCNLAFGIHIGTHAVHLRPQSNSMLPYPYLTQSPNNRGAAAESPVRMLDLCMTPMPLRPTEEIDCFATQNNGAGETQYCLFGFSDGPAQPMQFNLMPQGLLNMGPQVGRAFSVHATSSTTLTSTAWSGCALTFDQTLPPGTYALIGLSAFSATGKYCRAVPTQGPVWRPGTIVRQAYDSMDPWYARAWPVLSGKVVAPMGIWLYFTNTAPITVEIYATSGDTAEEFWLDLVYISPNVINQ